MKVNDLTNAVNAYENTCVEADEAFERYNGLSDKEHELWLACRTKVSEYFFKKIYECMKSFDNYKPDETWESRTCTKFVGDKNAPIYVTNPSVLSAWMDKSSGIIRATHRIFISIHSDDKINVFYPIWVDMEFDYNKNEVWYKHALHLVNNMHFGDPNGNILRYCYCALNCEPSVSEESFCEWLTHVMSEPFATQNDLDKFINIIMAFGK